MKTNKGFSLVEVLVAVAVLAVGLLALAQMQIIAMRVNTGAGRLSRATALAQDKIEQLMAVSYDNAMVADLTITGQITSYTEANPPQGYTITWTVDTDTLAVGIKTINVTVKWRNRGGKEKDFKLAFCKERINDPI